MIMPCMNLSRPRRAFAAGPGGLRGQSFIALPGAPGCTIDTPPVPVFVCWHSARTEARETTGGIKSKNLRDMIVSPPTSHYRDGVIGGGS